MGNKKKYALVIILFIFFGLMIFTFANPSSNYENEGVNQNVEDENIIDDNNVIDDDDSDDDNVVDDNNNDNNNNKIKR